MEDFHTEIAAQVLRECPTLALAWLRQIGATMLPVGTAVTITTQETFPALSNHEVDSRPDMVLRLTNCGHHEIVFVESKVGSFAGDTQLERYMEHLADQRNARQLACASLVFVTRDFETDYTSEFSGSLWRSTGALFHQTRWSIFHHLLCTVAKDNPLAKQLALFMQENRMSLSHRFRTIDVAALENFLAAHALMDETLRGKVAQNFESKLKDISRFHSAWSELTNHNRYILYASSRHPEDHFCMIGYWLPNGEADGVVNVGLELACGPEGVGRKEYEAAFGVWASRGSDWEAVDLHDPQRWCSIRKWRPLSAFLGEADHVESIRSFLLGAVDEIADFLAAHPALPWRQADATV